MPAIRHASKRKAPPAGFSDIEDSLLVFANKMKDAENAPNTAGPKHQALWPIFQVSHQRSRYVFELYRQEKISKQLYDWLCKNGYADAMLIAKWKKDSYAKVSKLYDGWGGTRANGKQLCCLRCIQTKETNFNSTCICRVPKANLKEDQEVECVSCGCKGCASGD